MPDQRFHPQVGALDQELVTYFARTDATAIDITSRMTTVVVTVTGSYAPVINLPHPAEMPGRFLSIEVTGASGGTGVLNTGGTNATPYEYGTVDGQALGTSNQTDAVLLLSDGRAWWRVASSGL